MLGPARPLCYPASSMYVRRALLALPLCFTWILACGSGSSGTDGAGGGPDGKLHPPTNGVAMSEADACKALANEQTKDTLALSCLSTSYTCPDRLRAAFGTSCLQYDQGSVSGCVAYYAAATTCDDLAAAVDACAVSPIEGSAPGGC